MSLLTEAAASSAILGRPVIPGTPRISPEDHLLALALPLLPACATERLAPIRPGPSACLRLIVGLLVLNRRTGWSARAASFRFPGRSIMLALWPAPLLTLHSCFRQSPIMTRRILVARNF